MKISSVFITSIFVASIGQANNLNLPSNVDNDSSVDFTAKAKQAIKAMKIIGWWDIDNAQTVEGTLKDIYKVYPPMHELSKTQPNFRERADNLKKNLLDLSFDYAEIALKSDKIDIADNVYRDLIKLFVGDIYSGIRDRAKIGLEDVRARKLILERQEAEKQAELAKSTNQVVEKKQDVYDELIKLNDLKKKGIITESEFKAQKAKILKKN